MLQDSRNDIINSIWFTEFLIKKENTRIWPRAGMVDSLDLKSSGIYSRGGSSPPEATRFSFTLFKK